MFLSRGDRDHGDAFQTLPVSQALARGEAKDSDILLGRDRYLLEPTEWPPGSQASCGVGERTPDCSPGYAIKESPHLAMTWTSRGFNPAGAPRCVSHEVRWRAQGASRAAPGKSGLHARGEGERVIALESC